MKKILILFTTILLVSCSTNKKEKEFLISELKTVTKKDIEIDSIKIPSFEIQIQLTKFADKKLLKYKETIIVKAFYSGIPIDKTNKDFLNYGELLIGITEIELTGNERIARFNKMHISREKFKEIENGEISVLINVFSGRKSSLYNILDCDILQSSINSLKGKKHIIKGKLL